MSTRIRTNGTAVPTGQPASAEGRLQPAWHGEDWGRVSGAARSPSGRLAGRLLQDHPRELGSPGGWGNLGLKTWTKTCLGAQGTWWSCGLSQLLPACCALWPHPPGSVHCKQGQGSSWRGVEHPTGLGPQALLPRCRLCTCTEAINQAAALGVATFISHKIHCLWEVQK